MGMGKDKHNFLQREGKNENLNYAYTAIAAAMAKYSYLPTASSAMPKYSTTSCPRPGKQLYRLHPEQKLNLKNLQRLESILKLTPLKKHEAAKPFIEVAKAIAPYLSTDVQGVNAADRLAALLAAHRNPVTFRWNQEPKIDIPEGGDTNGCTCLVAAEKEECHVL